MKMEPHAPALKAIVVGTLIVGTLDIADALIYAMARGHAPAGVLRAIASGLAGEKAFTGTALYLGLGLAIHYFIALSWVALFVLLALRYRSLLVQPLVSGITYGLVIYLIMNFVVLPLAGFGKHPHFTWIGTSNAILALVCCIGIPLAYITRASIKDSANASDPVEPRPPSSVERSVA